MKSTSGRWSQSRQVHDNIVERRTWNVEGNGGPVLFTFYVLRSKIRLVFVPLLFIVLATLSAGVVAYGTHFSWAQFPHGIELILWSRRLQWPLVTLSLLLCLVLIGLVISGKRRAWWLIGLAPVLALFTHRFVTDPAGTLAISDNPVFVPASGATFLNDSDYVVGLRFGEGACAYPYSVLYRNPVVIQSDHEKRMILIWSAFANRAVAQQIGRDLHARDLEIVSTPANALLLYNHTRGQFINGLTGQTTRDERPAGFAAPIVVSTMTWKDWQGINPQTKVMAPTGRPQPTPPPRGPILPTCRMPPAILDYPADTRIVLVGNSQPAALRIDQISKEPLHLQVDAQTVFVFREAQDKPVRAFSCSLKRDLIPHFRLNDNPKKHKNAVFVDTDTDSGWSGAGLWLDGDKELRGTRLTPIPVQDGLYWGVMKFWYPKLRLSPAPQPSAPGEVTSAS